MKNIIIAFLFIAIFIGKADAQTEFIKQNEKNRADVKAAIFSKNEFILHSSTLLPSDRQQIAAAYIFVFNGKKDLGTENILSSLQVDSFYSEVLFYNASKFLGSASKSNNGFHPAVDQPDSSLWAKMVMKASRVSAQFFFITLPSFAAEFYPQILCYIDEGQLKFILQDKKELHEFSNITELINYRIGSVAKFWEMAASNKITRDAVGEIKTKEQAQELQDNSYKKIMEHSNDTALVLDHFIKWLDDIPDIEPSQLKLIKLNIQNRMKHSNPKINGSYGMAVYFYGYDVVRDLRMVLTDRQFIFFLEKTKRDDVLLDHAHNILNAH